MRSRIQEEIEKFQYLRPVPLRSAGYLGMLCAMSFGPESGPSTRRSVTPFLSRPEGFIKEEVIPQVYSPPLSPEPPVILEEYVELHGDRLPERKVEPLCLLWNKESPPSRSSGYSLAAEREWKEKMARVLGELEMQKGVIEKQQIEITLTREEVVKEKLENSKLTESLQSVSERLTQSQSEKEEWKKKSEEVVYFVSQILKETEVLNGEVIGLTREKSE